MKQILFSWVFGVISLAVVHAQPAQTPKPGPEHKKLGMFLGTWSLEGEFKSGNGYGIPAGKVAVVEKFQWMPGEFFLQMNRDGKGPAGEVKHMIIFGYDSITKKYTGAWFNLLGGGSIAASLTNSGNTWIWTGSGHTADGKLFQERCTCTVVPNASYTVKCDTSPDGKTWSPSFETRATKSK